MKYRIIKRAGSFLKAETVDSGMLKCPLCGALFASEEDLIRHIIAHAMGYTSEKRNAPERG